MTQQRVLVLGNGMIGKALVQGLEEVGAQALTSNDRITNEADVVMILEKHQPDVVINAAGRTGRPNVDWCEDHKDEVFFANVELPRLIAVQTEKQGIRMTHLSSGCIYAGAREEGPGVLIGFTEEDAPNFEGSFYSFTKKVAERLISDRPHVLTTRLRIPLIPDRNERGILAKLMKYETIIDIPNSISYLPDYIRSVVTLVQDGQAGIWNVTNPEPITHRRTLEIYDQVNGTNVSAKKKFIDAKDLDVRAPRSNCILSSEKLQKYLAARTKPTAPLLSTEEAFAAAAKAYGA